MAAPLHHLLTQAHMQIIDDRQREMEGMVVEYRNLLALVRAIKEGAVNPQDVIVTDDGWQLMPPEPEEEEDDGSPSYTNGSQPAYIG